MVRIVSGLALIVLIIIVYTIGEMRGFKSQAVELLLIALTATAIIGLIVGDGRVRL